MIISKQQFIPATILAVLVPVFILLYDYQNSTELTVYAEVSPRSEWIMARGRNDQIISSVMNNQTGVMTDMKILQFDRGEAMSLRFSKTFENSKRIFAGDTIAQLTSSDLNEQIVSIENELSIAKATLAAGVTGEKEAVIKELLKSKDANSYKLQTQRKIKERNEALHSQKLISDNEYELSLQEFKQLEFNGLILDAKIESVTTGDKPEVISLFQTKIKSFERTLEVLKNRKLGMVIVSPITGTVIPSFNSDTLLSVIDVENIILKVPLKLTEVAFFHEGDSISVVFSDTKIEKSGVVSSLAQTVKMFGTEPVRIMTIEISNSDYLLLPGMVTQIKLYQKSAVHAN